LFAKTARLFDLAKTKVDLLETPSADVFQAPVKGFVKGLYLSGDEHVLALAKRRSVLFFSAKALEHKVPRPPPDHAHIIRAALAVSDDCGALTLADAS
jgi:hypothetical protein